MGQQSPHSLIEILQKTLQQLETTDGFDCRDPAYIELTRHIARVIAELEVSKSESRFTA